jgi:hypothetical protein
MVTAKWREINTHNGAPVPWQSAGTEFQQYSSQVASSQATALFTTTGANDGFEPDGTQEPFVQQYSPQAAARTIVQEAPFQQYSSQGGSSQAGGSSSATPRFERPTNACEEWQTPQPQPSRSKINGRQNMSALARDLRMPSAAAHETLPAFAAPAERMAAKKAKRNIAASMESDAIGRRNDKPMHRPGKGRRL